MPPMSLRHASAPSPTLLRFLRAQSDPQRARRAALLPRCAKLQQPRRAFSLSATTSAPLSTLSSQAAASPRPAASCIICAPLLRPSATPSDALFSPVNSILPVSRLRRLECPIPRRTFATTRPVEFLGWSWWNKRARKSGAGPLQPNDLPARHNEDDSGSLARVLRSTNEPRIRCTEFDENGNVTLVNGEFKKAELIAKYGLLPRDLRKIDSSMLPHILVRPSAILLNLLHLRVLIKHNRVLVFDAYGTTNSYTQSVFMYDLEGRLRQKDLRQNGALPYEFRALEAVLLSVTSGLESEFEGVHEPVVRVLRELEEDIDRDKLRYLLIYSKKLGSFEQQARLVRDALEELLEADDDLAAMYLTEKALGKERGEQDHAEVELLLESYHKIADEIVQAAENLVSNIRNTEEIVKAILDANRNSLMLLDLKFSVWTVGLAAGTFVAALYGMNLKNFIEESDIGFWGVSAWCAVFTLITTVVGLSKLRRVQRVSMWGEHGRRGNSWRDVAGEVGPHALLGPGANPRVPPVGMAAAGVNAAGVKFNEKHVEKLRRLKELHAAQAQGVFAEVQAAKKAAAMQRQAHAQQRAEWHAQHHAQWHAQNDAQWQAQNSARWHAQSNANNRGHNQGQNQGNNQSNNNGDSEPDHTGGKNNPTGSPAA